MTAFHTFAIPHNYTMQQSELDEPDDPGNLFDVMHLESKVKKLLDGFSAGLDCVQEKMEKEARQGRLP